MKNCWKKGLAVTLSASLIFTTGDFAAVKASPLASLQFELTPPYSLGQVTDYFNAGALNSLSRIRGEGGPPQASLAKGGGEGLNQGTPSPSSRQTSGESPAVWRPLSPPEGGEVNGGRSLVILIQDLHARYGVQKNIAGILEFLSKKLSSKSSLSRIRGEGGGEGLNRVPFALAVEGASGPIDSSVMALFPDRAIKEAAADYLMREGELTGAEYFAVMRSAANLLVGVEDPRYYNLHRDLFRKTLETRARLVEMLRGIQKDILGLRRTVYSKPLKSFQAKADAFEAGTLGLRDYWDYLASESRALGMEIQLPDLSNTREMSRAMEDAENLAFMLKLQKTQSPREKDLVQVEHDLDFLLRVSDLQATETEVRTFGPRMNQFIALADSLLSSSRQSVVPASSRPGPINMDPPSVTAGGDREKLGPGSPHNRRPGPPDVWRAGLRPAGAIDSLRIKELISSSIDYYALALARNKPMVENTLRLLSISPSPAYGERVEPPQSKAGVRGSVKFSSDRVSPATRPAGSGHGGPQVAVLVAGGFHTAPITQELRRRNISYAVISPNVEESDEAGQVLYVKRLDGQVLSTEEILGSLNPPIQLKLVKKLTRDRSTLAVGLLGSLLLGAHFLSAGLTQDALLHYHQNISAALPHFLEVVKHAPYSGQAQAISQNWAAYISNFIAQIKYALPAVGMAWIFRRGGNTVQANPSDASEARRIIVDHFKEVKRQGQMANWIHTQPYWFEVFKSAGHLDLLQVAMPDLTRALEAGFRPYNETGSVTAEQFANLALQALGESEPEPPKTIFHRKLVQIEVLLNEGKLDEASTIISATRSNLDAALSDPTPYRLDARQLTQLHVRLGLLQSRLDDANRVRLAESATKGSNNLQARQALAQYIIDVLDQNAPITSSLNPVLWSDQVLSDPRIANTPYGQALRTDPLLLNEFIGLFKLFNDLVVQTRQLDINDHYPYWSSMLALMWQSAGGLAHEPSTPGGALFSYLVDVLNGDVGITSSLDPYYWRDTLLRNPKIADRPYAVLLRNDIRLLTSTIHLYEALNKQLLSRFPQSVNAGYPYAAAMIAKVTQIVTGPVSAQKERGFTLSELASVIGGVAAMGIGGLTLWSLAVKGTLTLGVAFLPGLIVIGGLGLIAAPFVISAILGHAPPPLVGVPIKTYGQAVNALLLLERLIENIKMKKAVATEDDIKELSDIYITEPPFQGHNHTPLQSARLRLGPSLVSVNFFNSPGDPSFHVDNETMRQTADGRGVVIRIPTSPSTYNDYVIYHESEDSPVIVGRLTPSTDPLSLIGHMRQSQLEHSNAGQPPTQPGSKGPSGPGRAGNTLIDTAIVLSGLFTGGTVIGFGLYASAIGKLAALPAGLVVVAGIGLMAAPTIWVLVRAYRERARSSQKTAAEMAGQMKRMFESSPGPLRVYSPDDLQTMVDYLSGHIDLGHAAVHLGLDLTDAHDRAKLRMMLGIKTGFDEGVYGIGINAVIAFLSGDQSETELTRWAIRMAFDINGPTLRRARKILLKAKQLYEEALPPKTGAGGPTMARSERPAAAQPGGSKSPHKPMRLPEPYWSLFKEKLGGKGRSLYKIVANYGLGYTWTDDQGMARTMLIDDLLSTGLVRQHDVDELWVRLMEAFNQAHRGQTGWRPLRVEARNPSHPDHQLFVDDMAELKGYVRDHEEMHAQVAKTKDAIPRFRETLREFIFPDGLSPLIESIRAVYGPPHRAELLLGTSLNDWYLEEFLVQLLQRPSRFHDPGAVLPGLRAAGLDLPDERDQDIMDIASWAIYLDPSEEFTYFRLPAQILNLAKDHGRVKSDKWRQSLLSVLRTALQSVASDTEGSQKGNEAWSLVFDEHDDLKPGWALDINNRPVSDLRSALVMAGDSVDLVFVNPKGSPSAPADHVSAAVPDITDADFKAGVADVERTVLVLLVASEQTMLELELRDPSTPNVIQGLRDQFGSQVSDDVNQLEKGLSWPAGVASKAAYLRGREWRRSLEQKAHRIVLDVLNTKIAKEGPYDRRRTLQRLQAWAEKPDEEMALAHRTYKANLARMNRAQPGLSKKPRSMNGLELLNHFRVGQVMRGVAGILLNSMRALFQKDRRDNDLGELQVLEGRVNGLLNEKDVSSIKFAALEVPWYKMMSFGEADTESRIASVNLRLPSEMQLRALIHETLHILHTDWSEAQVIAMTDHYMAARQAQLHDLPQTVFAGARAVTAAKPRANLSDLLSLLPLMLAELHLKPKATASIRASWNAARQSIIGTAA